MQIISSQSHSNNFHNGSKHCKKHLIQCKRNSSVYRFDETK